MLQTKILLDTNTYLRLARSIHPLLGKPFGKDNFTLYIHSEIEIELNRNTRLQTKFYWIANDEYKINRKKKLNIPKTTQSKIENTYEHIWEFQRNEKLGLSKEDIYCISTALEMQITLITDDQNMIKVCNEFDVKVYSTVGLLKIMFDNNFVDLDKILEVIQYLQFINDFPKILGKEFKRIFGNLIIE